MDLSFADHSPQKKARKQSLEPGGVIDGLKASSGKSQNEGQDDHEDQGQMKVLGGIPLSLFPPSLVFAL